MAKAEGCEKCLGRQRLTLENFLERSKEHHGNKYDYSKVVTSNVMSKVIIICPDHDPPREWSQQLILILTEKGVDYAQDMKITKDIFFIKAKEKHQNRFDYSVTNYKDYNTEIEFICPEHGNQKIRPRSHIMGLGCKKCIYEKMAKEGDYQQINS